MLVQAMLFPLYWVMPVHREPLCIKIVFNNFLTWLAELFSAPFRGTVLEWWLLQPDGQAFTQLSIAILAICIWYLGLNSSLWRTKADNIDVADDDDSDTTGSMDDAPIMRRLAPPGHQPINAQLGGSGFRLRNSLGRRLDDFSTWGQTSSQTPGTANSALDQESHDSSLNIRSEGSQAISATTPHRATQPSPGFTTFMSEMEKLKAHLDYTMSDLDKATSSPKEPDSDHALAIDRSKTAKRKTLREHYPQSVEHPYKFPSSSHFAVPSDDECGDDLVDF
ncbi:hypothetical protein J1614_000360 [Plenodomus biglobosus]|nr:hypothetical protein J1614_000360 [Plenodomus biglobosus]